MSITRVLVSKIFCHFYHSNFFISIFFSFFFLQLVQSTDSAQLIGKTHHFHIIFFFSIFADYGNQCGIFRILLLQNRNKRSTNQENYSKCGFYGFWWNLKAMRANKYWNAEKTLWFVIFQVKVDLKHWKCR